MLDLEEVISTIYWKKNRKKKENSIQFYKYNFYKLVKFYEKQVFTDLPLYVITDYNIQHYIMNLNASKGNMTSGAFSPI